MKKNVIIFLQFILCNLGYSQNSDVYVVPNQTCNCKVYAIKDSIITSNTYSLQNVKNQEFESLNLIIDSLRNEKTVFQKNLTILKDTLNQISELYQSKIFNQSQLQNLKHAKRYLEYGYELHSSSNVLNRNVNDVLQSLKQGNDYLKQSKILYKEDISGIYAVQIKFAKQNLLLIDSVLRNDSLMNIQFKRQVDLFQPKYDSLKTKIFKIDSKIYPVENKLRMENITEFILDYIPIDSIQRTILYVDINDTIALFSNSYRPVYGKYYFVNENKYQLIKNEIIQEDTLRKLIANDSYLKGSITYISDMWSKYIFEDISTQKKYYTECDFFDSCAIEKDIYLAKQCIKKNGGNIYQENDFIIIEYKGYKCLATTYVIEILAKGDISIILKMNSSVEQYKNKQLQAANKIEIMFKYYNLYKSKLLSEIDLIHWKKVTNECLQLLNQMSSLPYADKSEYYTQITYKNTCFYSTSEIIDMAMNCKRILGL